MKLKVAAVLRVQDPQPREAAQACHVLKPPLPPPGSFCLAAGTLSSHPVKHSRSQPWGSAGAGTRDVSEAQPLHRLDGTCAASTSLLQWEGQRGLGDASLLCPSVPTGTLPPLGQPPRSHTLLRRPSPESSLLQPERPQSLENSLPSTDCSNSWASNIKCCPGTDSAPCAPRSPEEVGLPRAWLPPRASSDVTRECARLLVPVSRGPHISENCVCSGGGCHFTTFISPPGFSSLAILTALPLKASATKSHLLKNGMKQG